MKTIKSIYIYSIFSIILVILLSLFLYNYFNPQSDNEDFNLEFTVSNEGKDFYKERNKNVEKEQYTYNDEKYFNDDDHYQLIIHSLDIKEGKERIIIVLDSLNKNSDFRIANITYKDESGEYSPVIIEHKKDSVYIIQIGTVDNSLMFKAKK